MRLILTAGGINTFINVRESKFLETHDTMPIHKKDLTEREKLIATQLCRKGVLNRHIRGGNTFYTLNVNKRKGE